MRILFVNFISFWGGGEQWMFQIMTQMQKRGHEVILLANTPSELSKRAADSDIMTHNIRVKNLTFISPVNALVIRRIINISAPDVIFVNNTSELKTIGLAIPKSKFHKVILNRGIPRPIKLDFYKKYLFKHVVSDIVVNSEYVSKSISNISDLLNKKPHVIHHCIDARSKYRAKAGSKDVAIVGRLSFEKGIDYAIKIFDLVLKSVPEAKLHIIGTGSELKNLKLLAADLQIDDSVVFHGFSDNVDEILQNCSALIMTSRWEGFGLVLLEAMRLRMPCISFNHIAANEIIMDGKTGYLIPYKDLNQFSDKLIDLLTNESLCREMGENAYQLLQEEFSIATCMDKFEQLFKT